MVKSVHMSRNVFICMKNQRCVDTWKTVRENSVCISMILMKIVKKLKKMRMMMIKLMMIKLMVMIQLMIM